MGEGLASSGTKTVEELIAEAKQRKVGGNGTKKPKTSRSKNTTNSDPEGGDTSTGNNTDGITIHETSGQKTVLGLAPVEEPETKASKSRVPKKTAKKKSVQEGAEMLAVFIKTISDISTIRPGMEIWSLQVVEAKAIADPLASIMDRYNLLEKMGEYGDIVALGLALGAAFVPRVMYTAQIQRGRKVKVNATVHANVPKRQPNNGTGEGTQPVTSSGNVPDGSTNQSSGVTTNGSDALKQLLPAIM